MYSSRTVLLFFWFFAASRESAYPQNKMKPALKTKHPISRERIRQETHPIFIFWLLQPKLSFSVETPGAGVQLKQSRRPEKSLLWSTRSQSLLRLKWAQMGRTSPTCWCAGTHLLTHTRLELGARVCRLEGGKRCCDCSQSSSRRDAAAFVEQKRGMEWRARAGEKTDPTCMSCFHRDLFKRACPVRNVMVSWSTTVMADNHTHNRHFHDAHCPQKHTNVPTRSIFNHHFLFLEPLQSSARSQLCNTTPSWPVFSEGCDVL